MAEPTILVVDDEKTVTEVVGIYLERAGYDVIVADDGETALEVLEERQLDLVVLDLMLPDVGGLEITRWLRARGNLPIIMLSARRDEVDRILGLELGADDYVVKPFSPQELVSRVRAVLRRSGSGSVSDTASPLEVANLRIDPGTRIAEVDGQEVSLTAKEFDLLWVLASHPRRVFNREQLLEQVWGLREYIDPSTVTVHIHRLREKIEPDPANPRHIKTVWGVGYRLEP